MSCGIVMALPYNASNNYDSSAARLSSASKSSQERGPTWVQYAGHLRIHWGPTHHLLHHPQPLARTTLVARLRDTLQEQKAAARKVGGKPVYPTLRFGSSHRELGIMATNLTPTVGAATRRIVQLAPPSDLLLRNGYTTPTMHGLVLTVETTGHRLVLQMRLVALRKGPIRSEAL